MRSIIFFLSFVSTCYSILLFCNVGFNFNPSSQNQIESKPRTVDEAIKLGYKKFRDCNASSKFVGNAYILNEDTSNLVLYDANGNIAGLQFASTKVDAYPNITLQAPFIRDEEGRLVLTFYFTDPATICTPGSPTSTGTEFKLYVQLKDSPQSSILVSQKNKDLDLKRWTKDICIPKIGQHYWLNLGTDSNCDINVRVFLISNNGQLVGIGWAIISNLQFPISPLIPDSIIKFLLSTLPSCLRTGFIVEEVYTFFVQSPFAFSC